MPKQIDPLLEAYVSKPLTPEEIEALGAVLAQIEDLDLVQAVKVLAEALKNVKESWALPQGDRPDERERC